MRAHTYITMATISIIVRPCTLAASVTISCHKPLYVIRQGLAIYCATRVRSSIRAPGRTVLRQDYGRTCGHDYVSMGSGHSGTICAGRQSSQGDNRRRQAFTNACVVWAHRMRTTSCSEREHSPRNVSWQLQGRRRAAAGGRHHTRPLLIGTTRVRHSIRARGWTVLLLARRLAHLWP